MNALQNWRDFLLAEERRYWVIALAASILIGVSILAFVVFSLIPDIRLRGEFISLVNAAETDLAAAQTAQAEAPGRLVTQITNAQARVSEASAFFLSQPQAAEALDRLYQYARESGVTIVELTDQSGTQAAGDSVAHSRTYGLHITGSLPRLVNFLARIRESTLPGFVITNVEITEGQDQHSATLDVTLYISPYAGAAHEEDTPGILLPPLQPLPPEPSPPAPTLLPTTTHALGSNCINLLGNGDFESDSGWIFGQAIIPPQYTSDQTYTGQRSMQLGYLPGAGAADRSSFSSIRQLVTIPADAGAVSLRWWHFYGTQETVSETPISEDRQEVLLLAPDERVLAVLQRVRRADNSWQQEVVDLSAYRGQSVYIYFSVFNDGNGLSTWMYIDSAQLEACSGGAPIPSLTNPPPPIPTSIPMFTPSPTSPFPTPLAPTTLPTATPGCVNLIANGDFEFAGNWIFGQSMTPPQFTTAQPYSGARSMQLGSPPGSGMAGRSSFSSIRQLVTIPANATVVSLRWWHLHGTQETTSESPGASADRQEMLLLRPDEQVLTILQRVRRADNGWQQAAIDLTAYRGQSVYIYFNVFNDGNGLSTWMHVDNVQLEVCSGVIPTPIPTTPQFPTPTGTATFTPSPTTSPSPTFTGTPTATPSPTNSPTATPPFSPLPTPAGCENIIVNGGFENIDPWILGPLAAPASNPVHSGMRSIQLGRPPGTGQDDSESYSSIRQLVTIPADAGLVSLRWWHLSGTQETVTGAPADIADRQEVILLGPDGQVLTILQRARRSDPVWLQGSADITAYRGQSVYIYFNVFNDGNHLPTWMYIDDVELLACSMPVYNF